MRFPEIARPNPSGQPIDGVVRGGEYFFGIVKGYPSHDMSQSTFKDALGTGRRITVQSTGLTDLPVLSYTIQMYDDRPFGTITVQIQNRTGHIVTVQDIRSVEAMGTRAIELGNTEAGDRVLSDSFSEDWPPMQIKDLGQADRGMLRAVDSQLIYNPQSKESLFFGALTSEKFLTILHLEEKPDARNAPGIASYRVDSTGTTEIQSADPESDFRNGPRKNLIELSLPVSSGGTISSERLMFAAGNDYYSQLDHYGSAVRLLHHARVSPDNLLGWWSWTAFYSAITEGSTWTNAQWLAQHLKKFGYDYFHLDLGYGYARSEYATPDASKFPRGLMPLTRLVCGLGLKMGFWTAPFEVSDRSWVYEHHKDWLVHNAEGEPIRIGENDEDGKEILFVLDGTNPGAQEYLRQTYRTLVNQWGARYIKLDFMDNTAIEGNYYRPHTTALEAQRIGLDIIREAVGENVLLDKDGSPMLNPVGIVDDGRISQDTGHSFLRSKEAAPGIAARYYMNGNFFRDDPDAFTISRQVILDGPIHQPLTLSEAQVSIALAAVSGGMYEIGDDLPTLGKDPDRVALVENPDLLQMAKLGRASLPVDLLTYRSEDEQPSIFLLREDVRQAMLAVFNWTEGPRSHTFNFPQLNLPAGHTYQLYDALNHDRPVALNNRTIQLDGQPAHSVRLIKIIDTSIAAAAPSVTATVPANAKANEQLLFSGSAAKDGVPALAYHWDFGDGVTDEGARLTHAYTNTGSYNVQLAVDGVDGVTWRKSFPVIVRGTLKPMPPQRYVEPSN
jgi:alpha-galactosidase